MDQLRQSVGLRAYGQNNPLVEYQTEGYSMYNNMVGSIEYEVTRLFMKSEIRQNVQREQVAQDKRNIQKQNKMQLHKATQVRSVNLCV